MVAVQGAALGLGTRASRIALSLLLVAVVGLLGLAVSLALSRLANNNRPVEKPLQRFEIVLPAEAPLAPTGLMPLGLDRPALAVSRDGRRLAYVAQVADHTEIHLRDMVTGQFRAVPGTEGGVGPVFSPDGRSLAFFAGGKLLVTSPDGAERHVLADASSPMGAAWADDGSIYFCPIETGGVSKIRFPDGPPEVVVEGLVSFPTALPGRPGLLVYDLALGTSRLDDGRVTLLQPAGWSAQFARSGHLVFARPGRLLAMRFSSSSPVDPEETEPLASGVRTGSYGLAQFALSDEGTLVYAAGSHQPLARFALVERDGRWAQLGLPEDVYGNFALSPDGSRLAVSVGEELRRSNLLVYDLATLVPTVLTPKAGNETDVLDSGPCWHPGGRDVFFRRRRAARSAASAAEQWLLRQPADGTAEAEVVWRNGAGDAFMLWPHAFAPDGSLLAFGRSGTGDGTVQSYRLALAGSSPGKGLLTAERLLPPQPMSVFPQLSPDGRWLLFASNDSGRYDVYVTPYPGPGPRRRISTDGGHEPKWNPKGGEIVYMYGPRMYSVDVTLEPEFRASASRLLFEGPFLDISGFSWDFTPDGQRFLMLAKKEHLTPTPTLQVITNVFDELRRRLPPDRN